MPKLRPRTPEQEKRFVVLVVGVGAYGGLLFLISMATQYVRQPDDFFHAKHLFWLLITAAICAAAGFGWGQLMWMYRQWARGRRMKAQRTQAGTASGQDVV
jgi:hypothetical protein